MSKTITVAPPETDVKTVSAKAKSVALEGERMLRVIATAKTIDRDLEVIDSESIIVPVKPTGTKYLKDMTSSDKPDLPFLIDHEWALGKQAGSLKSIFINDNGETEALVELSTVDNGERVYTLAKEGHLGNSFSIGYSYMNATLEDNTWYNVELLELSGVFKGSNRDARLLEVKSTKKEKSNMTDTKTQVADATKEELEARLAEIKAEQSVEVEEKIVEDEAQEVEEPKVEAPAVEVPVETPVAEVVEEKTEEVKTINQEKEVTKMSTPKEIAVKQVEEKVELPTQAVKAETKKIDKYDFAAKQFVAFVNKDVKALKELNEQAIKSYAEASGSKATYLNTGVMADGGAIVPEAQLLADVYTVLEQYSTVANDLRVITLTEGNSLNIASLIQDVIVSEVGSEGGTKPVTKPVFGEDELSLREFAGIAILTKKLVRQAAVNVFDILRDSFARAIANQRAILALTDATSGIVNQVGTGTIETAAALPTYAEIKSAPYQVPASAVRGAKYYISREALEAIDGELNVSTGLSTDVVRLDGEGLSGTFANGFRFAVEENLGKNGNPHVVFGSMSRYGILLRQGVVEAETFDTGIVVDGSDVSHNLLQQNKLAHRVAFYEAVGYPLPAAFAVSGEATS